MNYDIGHKVNGVVTPLQTPGVIRRKKSSKKPIKSTRTD